MKIVWLVLIFSVSFSMHAKNLYDVCVETKSMILKSPSNDITWITYIEKKYPDIEKFEFHEYSFPILVGKQREETAFGMIGSPELKFISRIDEKKILKMQSVNIDTFLSKRIEDSNKYPTLVGETAFSALKNSFSVSASDLDCDVFIGLKEKSNLDKKPIRKLILVLLKSSFSPYKAIDVINIKGRDAFLIRTHLGFEYHEMVDGKTLNISLHTDDRDDIDRFISNLPNDKGIVTRSIVATELMKAIKSKDLSDWNRALKLMNERNYSDLSIDVIVEHIGHLTSQ